MAEPRTYHQFKKIVRATAEKGSADIILANVKDDKQMKDLISLYEMQKATDTFDRLEYADLLREVADPLGKTWNVKGVGGADEKFKRAEGRLPTQGPLPYKPEEKKKIGRDEIADLINQVQSEPKKKKISAGKLLGEKSKKKSAAISPDKLIPTKEGKDDEVSPKSDTTKGGKTKSITSKGVDQLAVNLNVIAKELTAINALLAIQLKNDARRAKKMAQEARKEERDKKEKESESVVKKVGKNILNTVKKPFESFFQKVLKYLKNILLGTAVIGLLKWLKKPENQQKIQNFANFITDQLPIILGGLAGLLGLKIGSKILKVLKLLYKLGGAFINMGRRVAKFAKSLIDKLRNKPPLDRGRGTGSTTGATSGRTNNQGYRSPGRTRAPGEARAGGSFRTQQARLGATGTSLQTRPKGGLRGLGRGGFIGSLALLGVEIFKPQIQDMVAGIYGSMGFGIRAKDDKTLIDEALKLDEELSSMHDDIMSRYDGVPGGDKIAAGIYESLAGQSIDMYGIYLREMKRRGLIDEDGNIKGGTQQVDMQQGSDDPFEGLNFDMDLGKAEMADLKQEVEGGTPPPRKVDPAKTNLGSSQFERGGSEELDSLSGVRAFASGVAKNAPDYSSKMKMKETRLNVDNITSDPSMFGGKKNALYDIPTPRQFSQTIVKPPTIDPQSSEGASGMASPARNDSPRFSPFDTNNPTLGPVLSIYNALV